MIDERIMLAEKCLEMAELAGERLRERDALAARLAEAVGVLARVQGLIAAEDLLDARNEIDAFMQAMRAADSARLAQGDSDATESR